MVQVAALPTEKIKNSKNNGIQAIEHNNELFNTKKKKKKQSTSDGELIMEDSAPNKLDEHCNSNPLMKEKTKRKNKSSDGDDLIKLENVNASKSEKKRKNENKGETDNGDANSGHRKGKTKKEKNWDGDVVNGVGNLSTTNVVSDNEELNVKVSGMGCEDLKFKPLQSFSEVQVSKDILKCCADFKKPSPIQSHSWPFLLDGRNLIGIAATGSGKTLAFGLPALVHVMKKKKTMGNQSHPICLVLSPTRELAQQITEVLVRAGDPCGVRTVCLYGGTSKKPQISALKSGVEILVATPGRLQDLLEAGQCSLHQVSYVVLDEADRMLDLGFEHVVRSLIGQTLKSRQMIMFSATWPVEVDQLSKEFMGHNPIKVIVGSQDLAANHAVTQVVEVIDSNLRDNRLIELLREYHKSGRNRVLVFVLYKKEAVRVENLLQRKGWKVTGVHGDKGQFDRNKAVMSFKDGTCPLLIATDVAARGLDIPDVEYVINYSFPLTTEDYVHRIGRTGRAGKSGIAHTFFTQADKARAGELVNVLKEAGQNVPTELLKFGTSVKKKESKLYGAHFKELSADAPKATKITFDSDED